MIQRLHVIFAGVENFLGIDVEVMVRDYIPHTLCTFPVYLRVTDEKLSVSQFVQFFEAFADRDDLHADCIKFFETCRSSGEIIRMTDGFGTDQYF
jgi:hypothetical protein